MATGIGMMNDEDFLVDLEGEDEEDEDDVYCCWYCWYS